ncbi:glycosyltransferase family 4 protein [Cylindrospermopsis curvispora]|uniref:Glycosyltransferase family 4 protein n=1 Tax=Cylindrospermopsis curvispora GIHE-G1 TaxID=2666332 RepID=A0A7H0F1X0_9CYAN|nr:glycosyltransferase family 1 protein [Cylindrospermopsis curvispora]QNP30036.1 glycosyltransferase family 4 protein [Cylindrospermopsis curvispora GIHE-G1]
MLIIGIDIRFALKKRRGIGNYTLNLLQSLAKIDQENQYFLYTNQPDSENILPKAANFKIRNLVPANYLLWEQLILPRQAIKDRIDILHCTANTSPAFLKKSTKLIVTIHDVMYLKDSVLLPKSNVAYQRLGRIYRSAIVSKTIRNATKVITVSNFSKSDILHHFPSLQTSSIITTYEAPDAAFRILDRGNASEIIKNSFNLSGKYLLTLGGTDPRKNTKLVIRAFSKLKQTKNINEKLVIVGIPNWKQSEFYDLVCLLQCENDVIFTDYVTQKELVCLYNCATLFIYPSLYEGFGIPPLESMVCGTPVITSNTTSIPEIVGDAALQVDPNNQEELEVAVYKLLIDHSLRDNLIQRGLARAKKFSWRRMAEETLDVYKSIIADDNNL